MSERPIDLVKGLYQGLPVDLAADGALDAWRQLLEPVTAPDFRGGDPKHEMLGFGTSGYDQFFSQWAEWLSAWESWWVDAEDFLTGEDGNVVVLLDVRARSRTDGVEVPMKAANLVTVEGGRIRRLFLYFDRAIALADAGAEPSQLT